MVRHPIYSTLLSLTSQYASHSTPVDDLELDFGSRVSQGNQSVRSRVEETLAELDAIKRTWKERYNATSMISRLPVEVLSIIFQICARSAQLEQGRLQQIGWTVVLHVCTHWRRVALACPHVWSYVTFAYSRWTEAMIERSKSVPLTVHVVLYSWGWYRAMCDSLLSKMSRRIRELSFTLLDSAGYLDSRLALFMSSLCGGLDDDAGPFQLEDLTVYSVPHNYQVVNIPTTILHPGTCHLRNLRLDGVGGPWESPFLIEGLSLTSLTITRIPINRGRPTVSQVIRVLGRLPNLQFLCLDSIGSFPGPNLPNRVVYLNHLSHLELDCTPTCWTLLLSHLVYPPLRVMRLVCTKKSTPKADVLAGLLSIDVLGPNLRTQLPIRCIVVSRFSSGPVILQTWTERGTRSGPPSLDPALHLEISSQIWPADQTVDRLLIGICDALALGPLEALHLEGLLVEADFLLEIFGKLKSLNTIRFVRPDLRGHGVVEALSAGIVRDMGEKATAQVVSDSRLGFAALRNLVCEFWTTTRETDRPWQALANCLKERRRRGAGIQKLFLRSNWLSAQEIHSLKSKDAARKTCMSEITVISDPEKPQTRSSSGW